MTRAWRPARQEKEAHMKSLCAGPESCRRFSLLAERLNNHQRHIATKLPFDMARTLFSFSQRSVARSDQSHIASPYLQTPDSRLPPRSRTPRSHFSKSSPVSSLLMEYYGAQNAGSAVSGDVFRNQNGFGVSLASLWSSQHSSVS